MRIWVIAAILATSSVAAANPSSPMPAMTDYFDGEITGGWTLMGMGAAGLTAGGFLYADGGDVARGASYVALGFGTAHLAAGIYVNIASRIRKRVYRAAIDKAPTAFTALERKRMEGVSTQFLVLKIVEVALIAGGGTMAVIGHRSDRPRLEGAGYALAAEAAATLVFDIVAARRAHRYRARLRDVAGEGPQARMSTSLAIDLAGQPVLLVGRAFAF